MNVFKFFEKRNMDFASIISDEFEKKNFDCQNIADNALDLVFHGKCKDETCVKKLHDIFKKMDKNENFLSILICMQKIAYLKNGIEIAYVFCQKKEDFNQDFISSEIKKNFGNIGFKIQEILLEKSHQSGFIVYFKENVLEFTAKNILDNIKKDLFNKIDNVF